MSFAYMLCGVGYDSSMSDVELVSPTLRALRDVTKSVIGDFVFAHLYQGHRTGETTGSFEISETSHEPRSETSSTRPSTGAQRSKKIARKKSSSEKDKSSSVGKGNSPEPTQG